MSDGLLQAQRRWTPHVEQGGRDMTMNESSILSMLHGRARLQPDGVAFVYTDYSADPAGVAETVTWSQLSRRTLNAAREFRSHGAVGDRAMILAPQGLDYIVSFLAAMQAGLIAVPISRTPRDYLIFFRREIARTVSLYVNEWNHPARRAYRAVGFRETGRFSTVMF
mgnify:CR=1 FL=1